MDARFEQFKRLVGQGFTPTQAANACNIDLDGQAMAALAVSEEPVTVDEILDKAGPLAARVLVEIVEDCSLEPKDRIAAAKLILHKEGPLPMVGVDFYSERMRRMKQALGEVIDMVPSGESNRLLSMAS